MSNTYYPLIGIDRDRNEHPFEWPGRSWEDAAKTGAERYSYVKVLSNFTGQKRGGNGSGMYHRKPLYQAPIGAYSIPNGSAANGTLGNLLPMHLDALQRRITENPQLLIEHLRTRGLMFTLTRAKGKTTLIVEPNPIHCTVKQTELGVIRDLIRQNMSTFIDTLETEALQTDPPHPPDPEPADPLKGKKLQEILLSMLPQMPTPFSVDDMASRVTAAEFTQLGADRRRLTSNIHYAITKGQVRKSGSRGKYEVVEAYRHRRAASKPSAEYPLKEAFDSAFSEEPAPSEPVSVTPPSDPQPALSLQSLQPPREVIEVGPPPPDPKPTYNLQTALRVIEAPPSPKPQPEPIANPQAQLIATVLDLASQAAAGDDDTVKLAEAFKEAFEVCQNTMLDALTALATTAKPLFEQITKRAAAKQSLVRSLTAQPTQDSRHENQLQR